MDFEDIIRNGAEALKNEAMAKQPIITLGELIAKLEAQPVECGFCGNLCKVYKYGQTKEMK